MRAARAWVTMSIIAICWLVFAVGYVVPGERPYGFSPLIMLGAIIPSKIAAGEWWRLVTAGFLHFSIWHIFFNTYALFQAGSFVEYAYGSARYALIYAGALIAGSLTAYYTTIGSAEITAGASGAIMGVFGAMVVLGLKLPAIRGELLRAALLPIILTLGYGFMNTNISNAAHIGGLIAGALIALPLRPQIEARLAGRDPEILPPEEEA